jgi:hypothetical protein
MQPAPSSGRAAWAVPWCRSRLMSHTLLPCSCARTHCAPSPPCPPTSLDNRGAHYPLPPICPNVFASLAPRQVPAGSRLALTVPRKARRLHNGVQYRDSSPQPYRVTTVPLPRHRRTVGTFGVCLLPAEAGAPGPGNHYTERCRAPDYAQIWPGTPHAPPQLPGHTHQLSGPHRLGRAPPPTPAVIKGGYWSRGHYGSHERTMLHAPCCASCFPRLPQPPTCAPPRPESQAHTLPPPFTRVRHVLAYTHTRLQYHPPHSTPHRHTECLQWHVPWPVFSSACNAQPLFLIVVGGHLSPFNGRATRNVSKRTILVYGRDADHTLM